MEKCLYGASLLQQVFDKLQHPKINGANWAGDVEVLHQSAATQGHSSAFHPLPAHPGHGRNPYKHFHTHYFPTETDCARFLL